MNVHGTDDCAGMRVLLLGPYPPPHGGVETNLVAIERYLQRRAVPCAAINLTRHRREDGGGVYYPKSALGVLRLLMTLPYDVAHLHIGGGLPVRLLVLGLVCSLIPGKRTVFTFHSGGYPSSPEGRTARPLTLRGFVFRRFDRLIAVNAQIAELFHRFGVRADKVRLISPYAVPAEAAAPEEWPAALREFCAAHDPVLFTVAQLEPEYDLGLQIRAMPEIRKIAPDAGLAIAGSGSLEAELRREIAASPESAHILLCGDVPHAATLGCMARSAAVLRTTLYDGDSVAVREALHLGVPVIATDNGMRPAGVRLIPVGDGAALVREIGRMLREPRQGRTAPQPDESNLDEVRQVYEEVLRG